MHRYILCVNSLVLYPPPPLILGGALLYLRSLKGGCCSISDDLSCSFSFPLFTILWPMRVNLVHIIIQFDFKRLWSEKNGRGGGGGGMRRCGYAL